MAINSLFKIGLKKTSVINNFSNGDIWMACAFFFWFALAAYAFEIIIEHDLFGNCGFSKSLHHIFY